jgi:flagellin
VIDATIRVISDARAKFGATRNRLNNSLGYMDTLKQTTARTLSKIQDADMAFEMASLVRENILAKSGISMIAQIQDGDKLMSQLIANATGGR